MIGLFLTLISSAYAVPAQLIQQGRLLDSTGSAIVGSHGLTFRLFDSSVGGVPIWEETVFSDFENGYYTAVMGSNPINPLDDSFLAIDPLYLEIQVDGNAPLTPRQTFQSTPYARKAGVAESLVGGPIDVDSVSINGSLVVDSNGSWVGPVMNIGWSSIQNIPNDIADGDNDTLAAIQCSAGEILGWDGAAWGCAADNGLTEAEVENFIANAPFDLAAGSTVGGESIVTPTTDLVLTEMDVEAYVVNDPLDFAGGSTLGGQAIVSTASLCLDGEVLSWDASAGEWVCNALVGLFDADSDGVFAWDDCDDADPSVGPSANDQDCDGILTADDCNDADPQSTSISNDGDCDGVTTGDDCDDTNPSLGAQSNDNDCDMALSAVDCDDTDPTVGSVVLDADCDGYVALDDCDDSNASINPGTPETCDDGIDNDCDGVDESCACDPNPSGTLLITTSGYCDPSPPSGWSQCAGWINTSGDDVSNDVLNGCLNNQGRLRIKVWDANGVLEEDVYSTDTNVSAWQSWSYLGGNVTKSTSTYWTGSTTYFSTTGGGSACYLNNDCGVDAPCGTLTLGTGNGSSVILAPGWANEFEYRVNCNGQSLVGRKIAVYN